jgi:hypothetical protein
VTKQENHATLATAGAAVGDAAKTHVLAETNAAQNAWARQETVAGIEAGSLDLMADAFAVLGLFSPAYARLSDSLRAMASGKAQTPLASNVRSATHETLVTVATIGIGKGVGKLDALAMPTLELEEPFLLTNKLATPPAPQLQLSQATLDTQRAMEIHGEIIKHFELTAEQAHYSFTVSLTRGEGLQEAIINVTNPEYWEALRTMRIPLRTGEVLGSRIELVGTQAEFHAEIQGVWDAQRAGATTGTTTSSIRACERCGMAFYSNDFPGWTHVNMNPQHWFHLTPRTADYPQWIKPQ